MNVALYTNDEVSREHLRLRRDPARGSFLIVDKSMNGTWLDGKRLTKGREESLPSKAECCSDFVSQAYSAYPARSAFRLSDYSGSSFLTTS